MFIKNKRTILVNSGVIITICVCIHIVYFCLPKWEYTVLSFEVIRTVLIAELIMPIINIQHKKTPLYFSLLMIAGLLISLFVCLLLNTLDILFFNRVMHQGLIETLTQIEIWGTISGRYIWVNRANMEKILKAHIEG